MTDRLEMSTMSREPRVPLSPNVGARIFQCDFCSKFFFNSHHLRSHRRNHIAIALYQCDICKKDFSLKKSLRKHMKKHTGLINHQCDVCKESVTLHSLEDHMKTHTEVLHQKQPEEMIFNGVHQRERFFKCEQCQNFFKNKQSLDSHRKYHAGCRVFECGICQTNFTIKDDLISHFQTHQMGSLQCDTCFESFSKRIDLDVHKKSHISKPYYTCECCYGSFQDKSDLLIHQKKHFSGSFQRHVCDVSSTERNGPVDHVQKTQ